MRPLPPIYKKNGMQHEVIKREGDVVLARSRTDASKPLPLGAPCLGYEVFVVKKCPEGKFGDKIVEAHESCPGNEQWGAKGWTFPFLAEAEVKFAAQVAKEAAKVPTASDADAAVEEEDEA